MIAISKSCQKAELETTLCGCCGDCGLCCYTHFCYPCASATAWASARDEPCQCIHCGGVNFPVFTRANIRHARGMPLNFCNDSCHQCCCPCCFTIQNLREIQLIKAESQALDDGKENVTVVVNQVGYPPQGTYPPQSV